MSQFPLVLRVTATAILAAAACHAFLGLAAERILDPGLPIEIAEFASLDSQNRFYGTMFGAVGVAIWISARDLPRYDPIIRCLLWGLLLAGLARLGAVLCNGWPSAAVTVLLVVELVAAPALLAWQSASRRWRNSIQPGRYVNDPQVAIVRKEEGHEHQD
jgi:hypothetical protein